MAARRSIVFLLALWLGLAPVAHATWSIILVDSATGEVAVGTATCLPGTDLRAFVPVIVVGVGAGATQSQVDPSGKHKKLIFNELKAGTDPAQIIALLKLAETVPGLKCSRQYGVVDMLGGSASFSGGCNGPFRGHRFGTVGTVSYAIQGNVLTGLPVVLAAEAAIMSSGGLLSDRLMAGMEAARSMGGDGRCSCDMNPPADSCGAPPVGGFVKSAHVGTVIVARVGDTDGPCAGGALGCAGGDYWLNLNYMGGTTDPDPVFYLADVYNDFKQRRSGQVDGVASSASWRTPTLLPGGGAVAQLDLSLADLNGIPLQTGGAAIHVQHTEDSAGLSTRQIVTDNADGTYSIRFLASATSGTDRFEISMSTGLGEATLYPLPEIDYPLPLQSSHDELSAALGGELVFDLAGPEQAAGQTYVLRLSLDSLANAPEVSLTLPPQALDAQGRATVELSLPPGRLAPLVGRTVLAQWVTSKPSPFSSAPAEVRILP